MLYPFKFKPIYKDYIWGGNNLKTIGKIFTGSKAAESWEISCHKEGISIVNNGEYKGVALPKLIKEYGEKIVGCKVYKEHYNEFPLLVKFIDAADNLSVQVHPNDEYAQKYEKQQNGKNEMWYIMKADVGSKLVYGFKKNINKQEVIRNINERNIENCLNYIEVKTGDVIYIPAGLVHSIGKGIMLSEIQQSSNLTYRLYDYNRLDKQGNHRQLHINKALDVINFRSNIKEYRGIRVDFDDYSNKTYKVVNKHFACEIYNVNGCVKESTNGNKFYIYIFIEGNGNIIYGKKQMSVKTGDSVLIPALLGEYKINGKLKAIKTYVPDIENDIVNELQKKGYSKKSIYNNINGLI